MYNFNEYVFTTNVFNKPQVLKNKDAVLTLVTRLILLDPGTIPTIPDAGVGLVKKYRYLSDDNIPELEKNIKEQIEKFLPYFSQVSVVIEIDSTKSLYIHLDLDDNVFVLKSKVSKNNEFTLDSLL